MNKLHHLILLFVLLLPLGCVDQYNIASSHYDELLVVNGFLSSTFKQQQVIVSRTSPINTSEFIPEVGATVQILDQAGPTILLTEESPGVYKTVSMAGTVGNVYTLAITTSDGRSYASTAVTLKNTPPIGPVYAEYISSSSGSDGFQIYLNTEDPSNQTHYYRWEYEETYEIKTPYDSKWYWIGGNSVTDRGVPVSDCWASDTSKNILIATTIGLEADKVTKYPIRAFSGESQAMVVRYSLLVRQFALSEHSYAYWKNLRKINETQGSLFDIQPGEVLGNMISVTDPGESVLGYFEASSVIEKRVFFTPDQFPDYIPPVYQSSCSDNNISRILADQIGVFMQQYQNSFDILDIAPDSPPSYLVIPKPCCNCTDLGTNIKPPYW